MQCILALDTGGSKSEAALVRDDGTVLGWGVCREPGLSGRSERAARKAVRAAMEPLEKEISALRVARLRYCRAGKIFDRPLSCAVSEHAVDEHEGALSLVDCDFGVVVLAGTGAFVHVRAPDGRVAHFDGLGPLLGDWGSGYRIGHRGVRAAMRASWHPRRRTALEEAIFAAFRVREGAGMIPLNFSNPDRSVIASASAVVDRVANAGDPLARRILEEAAGELAETLRDAIDSMDLTEEPLTLVGTGSVAKRSTIYWEHFRRLVGGFAPRLTPVREPLPSVAGMALTVLRRLHGIDRRAVRENLFASAGKFLGGQEDQTQ